MVAAAQCGQRTVRMRLQAGGRWHEDTFGQRSAAVIDADAAAAAAEAKLGELQADMHAHTVLSVRTAV
jgi:hypothetical protein